MPFALETNIRSEINSKMYKYNELTCRLIQKLAEDVAQQSRQAVVKVVKRQRPAECDGTNGKYLSARWGLEVHHICPAGLIRHLCSVPIMGNCGQGHDHGLIDHGLGIKNRLWINMVPSR